MLVAEPAIDLPFWVAGREAVGEIEAERVVSAVLSGFGAAEARSLIGAVGRAEAESLTEELWSHAADEAGHAIWGRPGFDSLNADADPITVLIELGVMCGTLIGGRRGDTGFELAENLATAIILERDLRNLVPSLRARHINRAARLLFDHAGLTAEDESSFHQLLGSVALGEGRQAVLEPWHAALDNAAAVASRFESPELAAWIEALERRHETIASREGSLIEGAAALAPMPLFGRSEVLSQRPSDLASAMARGFLLSDPELRESWEVHRRGFLGHAQVSAPFPAGLVLEVLARHGEDVSTRITTYLQRLSDQGFTYYDAPEFTWVETDTVGTVLRLLDHIGEPGPWSTRLQPHVAAALGLIDATGDVPVWLIDDLEEAAATGMLLLGERCGAIQARLLTAMVRRRMALAERAVEHFLAGFAERGLAIGVNYPPLYTSVAIRELLASAEGIVRAETRAVAAATLRKELEEWRARDLSPMQSALLISACLGTDDRDLASDDLVRTILDGQDPDGGWPAEPLFFVPNTGGSVVFHRSRLLTTALCLDGLERWVSE